MWDVTCGIFKTGLDFYLAPFLIARIFSEILVYQYFPLLPEVVFPEQQPWTVRHCLQVLPGFFRGLNSRKQIAASIQDIFQFVSQQYSYGCGVKVIPNRVLRRGCMDQARLSL